MLLLTRTLLEPPAAMTTTTTTSRRTNGRRWSGLLPTPPSLPMPWLLLLLALLSGGKSLDGDPLYAGMSLPAYVMDYKVHIDAGKEDCYFQYVQPGATLYVGFRVLKGGDGKAGFGVRNHNGDIVHPYNWQASSDYQEVSQHGGYYGMCIDNQFSRFAAKLVNLYINVVKYDEWDQFTKEINEMELSAANVTQSLGNVERNIVDVVQILHHSRSREDRDYNLLLDNLQYVDRWSLLQIVVFVATSVIQLIVVRRMFETKSTGYSKIRI